MISNQTISIHYNDYNDYLSYLDDVGFYCRLSVKNRITYDSQCREEFAIVFTKKSKKIGFASYDLDIKKLDQFFEKREATLNLPVKTVFYKTENNGDKLDDFVIIEPSPFWLETTTSRGLFTLFIRAAVIFYKNNFLESLQKYHLTKKCIPAIQHFMNGNTKPTFKNLNYDDQLGGFVQFFANRNQEELNKLLVKP